MSNAFVIRNATLLQGEAQVRADLAVADGKLTAIGPNLPDLGKNIDAEGMIATPGGVDPHAHIEQRSGMGLMNADTFETATRSAALGGTTSVISFAAQAKGQRLQDVVDDYAACATRGAMIDYAIHLSLSDPSVPRFEDDLRTLIAAGHRSVKVFTTYDIALSEDQIERILQMTGPAGALTCIHAEDDTTLRSARNELLSLGKISPKHHALARPEIAEKRAVARICTMAERINAPVMIFHVSCASAAREVLAARSRGAPIKAETCPHYLFMTAEVLDKPGVEGAKWMCSPPQRSKQDQEALWTALGNGTLDVISSDHAPYRFDNTGKLHNGPTPAFPDIANGLPGLETRMPLMFDAIINRSKLPQTAFETLTATAAADIYGLPGKGRLVPGADADIVLWDPTRTHTYGADDLHDNVGYNPYEGHCVTGWPVDVFLRGNRIVTDGKLTTDPGQGRWIDRSP
ncbi:dihydropyrimidinase [Rhodobacteraceae bacterium N5(2021)]|uniref:D-hydantoinase n=1 Tax=Gymnodinialimonas phycosphaerae TaxID=2841589 RepID=A0A975YG55_9RHOB|nr:dihydropyrimidinase [Gymnodinialimonas phycosphaerae]MBY4891351.1 dihydropyrimidinase [Gymnodinialimonas phycosphaerae]